MCLLFLDRPESQSYSIRNWKDVSGTQMDSLQARIFRSILQQHASNYQGNAGWNQISQVSQYKLQHLDGY